MAELGAAPKILRGMRYCGTGDLSFSVLATAVGTICKSAVRCKSTTNALNAQHGTKGTK